MTVRLNFLVEGVSEEVFVKQILIPHLAHCQVFGAVRMVTTSRGRGRTGRGGMTTYGKVQRDLSMWMKEQQGKNVFFTTFFDRYGLPASFPGMNVKINDPRQMLGHLEQALANDMGDRRFIPYLQLHEFEALLLADPRKLLVHYSTAAAAVEKLVLQTQGYGDPELINLDEPPSKRIAQALPGYDKVLCAGTVPAAIGLSAIRARCPHFDEWVSRLEVLGSIPGRHQS